MNKLKFLLIIFFFLNIKNSNAQSYYSYYEELDKQYKRFINEENPKQALDIAYQIKNLFFKNEGRVSSGYSIGLQLIGDTYKLLYDIDNKKTYADSALSNKFELINVNKQLGDEEYNGATLHEIANLYVKMNDFNSALQYFNSAKENFERYKKHEGNDLRYIICLNNLGNVNMDLGNISDAETLLLESYEKSQKILKKNTEEYAGIINNLANFYYDIGEYKLAKTYFQNAFEIIKDNYDNKHISYTDYLFNLALVSVEMADYKSALNYLKQVEDVFVKLSRKENYRHSVLLGRIYNDLGDYSLAFLYQKKSLELCKINFGVNSSNYAECLNVLGSTYFQNNKYDSAKYCFKYAYEISQKVQGKEHPNSIEYFSNVCTIEKQQGNFLVAEKYLKDILEIIKKTYGEDNVSYADQLNNLGSVYIKKKDYKNAESYITRALQIGSKKFGISSTYNQGYIHNLVNLYMHKMEYDSMYFYMQKYLEIKRKDLKDNFSWLSSSQRDLLWKKENYFYQSIIKVIANANTPPSILYDLCYNSSLISKSLLLESNLDIDKTLSNASNKNTLKLYTELRQLKYTCNKLISENSNNIEKIELYRKKAESLEKIILNTIDIKKISDKKFSTTWKDIQVNLSADDASIEFARFRDSENISSDYNYVAFVIRPGYKNPKMVRLGKENYILNYINKNMNSELYTILWRGIDSLLIGVKNVYYSPVGELNNVSFSSLCISNNLGNKYLIDSTSKRGVEIEDLSNHNNACTSYLIDKYNLYRLTSSRSLANAEFLKEKKITKELLLFGGIDYDNIPNVSQTNRQNESSINYALQVNLNNEKSRSTLNLIRMPFLAGTQSEIMDINNQLKEEKWKINTYSGKNAGENKLKELLNSKAKGILHIATHGFSFPEPHLDKHFEISEKTNNYTLSDDPMIRCGLMLGGSNYSWLGNSEKIIEKTNEDGILTATEVANLDLSNLNLVVLSACETGLGKANGSEGTFGLLRGFKLAGVDQLIVSLWPVPDKETSELMSLFYNDLSNTLDSVISFQNAQKAMRKKYPDNPLFWAGFVLVR